MTAPTVALALVPIAVLTIGGRGLLELIAPHVARTGAERWSLAFLLGTGTGTWLGWWGSLLFPGASRSIGLVVSLALSIVAISAARRREQTAQLTPSNSKPGLPLLVKALALIPIAVCGAAVFLSLVTPLGWDGLFNFEIKARLVHSGGTSALLPYFGDVSRDWSHPQYPLLLPLTEAWIYSWVGSPDQQAVKVLFPLFLISLMGVFHGALRRELSASAALAGCVGLALIPSFTVGPGGATTGYADLPLAAFIFGAVSYARRALDGDGYPSALVAGLLSAFACWTKREGLVLAACLAAAVAMVVVLGRLKPAPTSIGMASSSREGHLQEARGRPQSASTSVLLALVIGPALVVIPWWFIQSRYGIPETRDLLPLTLQNLGANLYRVPTVLGLMVGEFLRAGRWVAIWPAFVGMSILCVPDLRRSSASVLTAMVVGPVAIYSLVFVMSAWPEYTEHLRTTLPRLLLPIAPIAWFATVAHVHDTLGRRTAVALESPS